MFKLTPNTFVQCGPGLTESLSCFHVLEPCRIHLTYPVEALVLVKVSTGEEIEWCYTLASLQVSRAVCLTSQLAHCFHFLEISLDLFEILLCIFARMFEAMVYILR